MSFEVYKTSAENVIGATDAAFQKPDGIDENLVAVFLDTTPSYAGDALRMAAQLSLLTESQPGQFKPDSICGMYLCTAVRNHKAAVLRFVLEHYLPYKTFKARLQLTDVAGEAANQTKALYNISAHRQVIIDTFCDLGTYSQSLVSEGGGLYRPRIEDQAEHLSVMSEVIQDRELAVAKVRARLGGLASTWIDGVNVFDNLVTAYQRAANAADDPRAPIVYAGNAVESFLSQLADHHNVNIQNAYGINAKAEKLFRANKLLDKHKFMTKYLGHVRNAADHGVDQNIGAQWEVSINTAVEYVHVTQSVIRVIVKHVNGEFIV